MSEYRFSVFTATFNRAQFLKRVYDSLTKQTFQNFEWIIVDDGSVDNTEDTVKKFIEEGKLKSIRYYKKSNGGKHTAWRVATKKFKAVYVVTIDSDDTLTPDALDIFDKYWRELENSDEYSKFWEVKGRVQNEKGKLVGTPLPKKIFDSNANEILFKYKIKGEMVGCRKTSVLRNEAKVPDSFLFEDNCNNFGESIRWARAGEKYKTRYFEEIVRTYYSDAGDTLTKSNIKKRNIKNTYNNLTTAYYKLLKSRQAMLKWDKRAYIRTIATILYTTFCLNIKYTKLPLGNINLLDRIIFIALYIPMFLLCKIRG